MKKAIILLSFLLPLSSITAQSEKKENLFRVPFDFPLYLSGNFAELRSNHFHGGLDFKTEGVEGKPIRCIADGYISRITVSPGGYGNALYITHNNGYTSVHGHLKAFTPEVTDVLEKYQYANETFEVNMEFDASRFPVKRGEIVALAGNSGYSFGPHLHLEIRETETNEPIDPLLFYMDKVKDTTSPRAGSLMVYPQSNKGIAGGATTKRAYPFTAAKKVESPIEAWGKIGFGISAYDYMDGTSNIYGVYSVTLLADGKEIFRSVADKFSFSENRMINSWTDFEEYRKHGKWYMKSFIAPGNKLRMLRANENRGLVFINEERDYQFEYILADAAGNTSRYRFTVRGREHDIPIIEISGRHHLLWNQANIVQELGMELDIPKGMLYDDYKLKTKVIYDSAAVSFVYQLHDKIIPLDGYCPISIALRYQPIEDTSKYYIASRQGKWQGYAGGKYEDGWMKGRIRETSTYLVAIDTIPPKITPEGQSNWGRSGMISFKISDGETGIKSYKGYIDGQFVLFEYSSKNRRLTCRLEKTPVKKGGSHTLKLNVTDMCDNTNTEEYEFNY